MKKLFYFFFGMLALIFILFLFMRKADIPLDDLKADYAKAPSAFLEIDNMPVHYRNEGSGPALLLLHGTASSLHTWEPWVDELKDSFTCISVDLPAFGLTGPNTDNNYSTTTYNEFINELMGQLNIDSFHIAGNSLGGYIAWNYALDFPEKVNKLVLVASAGYPHEPPQLFKLIANPILAPILKQISIRSLAENNLKEVYFDDSQITEELIDRYYHMSLREGNRDALIARVKRRDKNRIDQISQLEEPTLLMWGEADPWVPFEDAHKFKENISNSILISYKDAGHVPMEEKPIQSAQDVKRFLLSDNINRENHVSMELNL